MKPETIYQALEHTSDEYIVSAHQAMEQGRRRMTVRRTLLMAACISLAVVMVAIPIASYVNRTNENQPLDPYSDLPIIEVTPEMVDGMFDHNSNFLGEGSSATSNYESVSVPDPQYLYLNTPPQFEYLPIYSADISGEYSHEGIYSSYFEPRVSRFADALGFELDCVYIQEDSEASQTEGYIDHRRVTILASQSDSRNTREITTFFNGFPVELDGEQLQIDLSDSDKEIAKKMDSIRIKCNAIFDTSFSDILVKRNIYYYDKDNDPIADYHPGIKYTVYFYNRSQLILNEGCDTYSQPFTDYVEIRFETIPYRDTGETNSIINGIDLIQYTASCIPTEEKYTPIGKAKMYTLEEAEELLRQGICYADNFCCLCGHRPSLPAIDFSNYDYVSFVYRPSQDYQYNRAKSSLMIPFYVFYKYKNDNEDGLARYYVTYVPAVKITGIEQYFSD